jgi:hypothetical protein
MFSTHIACRCLKALVLGLIGLIVAPTVGSAQDIEKEAMPLSNSPSQNDYALQKPLSFAQQQARFSAEQAALRIEWNKWQGFIPARPNTNSSFMYTGLYNFDSGRNYAVIYNPLAYRSPRWHYRW